MDYKKLLLIFFVGLVLVGCTAQVDDTPDIIDDQDDIMPEAPDDTPDEGDMQPQDDVRMIVVQGGNYYFEPSVIEISLGETVEIVFENEGGTHDFFIPELGVGTMVIDGGSTDSFIYTFDEAGTFDFECGVGTHAAQGMTGQIIVS